MDKNNKREPTPTTNASKGGRINEETKTKIMEELSSLVESGKILGVTNRQLSKELGITRQTVATYLKEIYRTIPEEDIKATRVKLDQCFKGYLEKLSY